jgi:hypothetical protein
MFDKSELETIDTALTFYWNHLNEDYEKDKAKGRHKIGWQLKTMQKIEALQSKIYLLENSM